MVIRARPAPVFSYRTPDLRLPRIEVVPFKQGFGIEPEPLVPPEAALTAKAWPRIAMNRTPRSLRGIEPLRRAVRRLKGQAQG